MFTLAMDKTHDGIWKGSRSGNILAFIKVYVAYTTTPNSKIMSQYKDGMYTGMETSGSLYDSTTDLTDVIGDIPPTPTQYLNQVALVIRGISVEANNKDTITPYAIIQRDSDGLVFYEAPQRSLSSSDTKVPWTWFFFEYPNTTTSETFTINMQLFHTITSNTDMDINSDANKVNASITVDIASNLLSGDVTGLYDTNTSTATVSGNDADGGSFVFYITVRKTTNCSSLSLNYCETGLENIGGAAKYCSDPQEAITIYDEGLVTVIVPPSVVLILIIVVPIVCCRVKHRCCFKRKGDWDDSFELK